MVNYAGHFNPNKTPQSEPADPRQVQNSAGGYSFALDDWKRLERWLILGAEGGTYYASERKLTRENAQTVLRCLDSDPSLTVGTIAEISEGGRAPKNDPAIFALALAASHTSPVARDAALRAMPRVCRTGTHLFQFTQAVDEMRGWGRGLKRAVADWYQARPTEKLCYQLAKYQQRNGWSHRDLLRLSHPKPGSPVRESVYRYAVKGEITSQLPPFLASFEYLKTANEQATVALIREFGFTHEMIATQHKNSPAVWEALLEKMPMTAMIRNLAKMTEVGLLKPLSGAIGTVTERLTNSERLKEARVHPIALLSALKVYAQGHGEKGKLTWSPIGQITDALDAAFYLSFQHVEPTGKRTLLALDVSGSMDAGVIAGVAGLTPRLATAALAMVTMRVEKNWHTVGFSHKLVDVPITPSQRLDDVIRTMQRIDFGRTDCAQPMIEALARGWDVDIAHVYTDSETWCGAIHPHQALANYRQRRGIQTKLAVVGMTATGFTIADPADPGQLDVVGFDTATPNLLADFARG